MRAASLVVLVAIVLPLVLGQFWAYQLGVKADANPGVNNVAYTTAKQLGQVTVRCSELCGLWHGAMYDYGKVVTATAFQSWARQSEVLPQRLPLVLAPENPPPLQFRHHLVDEIIQPAG